jgi:SNF2 family DNA or RNA helicase
MSLADLKLKPVYNHSNCPDMIAGLYEPLLHEAVRYDRTTYTFTAKGLIAAAAGTAGLIRNGGRIRLICDHTVRFDILQALRDGQIQADTALLQTHDMEDLLLTQPDDLSRDHLELATWLVANGIMEIKVAIRDPTIFHAKSGIVEDAEGNRVAFSGSLNETLSGWTTNWESIRVFNDREGLVYIEPTEEEFRTLWANQATGLNIISLPKLYRDYIIEKAPVSTPKLLRPRPRLRAKSEPDVSSSYWKNIRKALKEDPDSTAATIPASLWPHQEKFRQQHADATTPVRRLIADEVGLGKTLEAGVILKTRLNQGPANKSLIIAPKAATKQWQGELFMKFAIDAPIIDSNFRTYRNGHAEPAGQPPWDVPLSIASQQWLVRNADQFLQSCGDYDLVICDEAHRARFRDVDDDTRRQPNQYLRMMYRLCRQTRELLLLTATPMQMNEMELWALFGLLEPEGWNEYEYRRFYRDEVPDVQEWKFRRDLWRKSNPSVRATGVLNSENEDYLTSMLQDRAVMSQTMATMESSAPAKRLMSRHTRQILREYRERGLLDAPIPTRRVKDTVITMTTEERRLYDQITEIVSRCYGDRDISQQSLGFIRTIFRKRLGSSTYAYAQTLRNAAGRRLEDNDDWVTMLDDADLDEDQDSAVDALQKVRNVDFLLKAAEEAERLSYQDTKRSRLSQVIRDLREDDHSHILMFTQFRDTQKWLADYLRGSGHHVTELYGQDHLEGDRGERLAAFQRENQGFLLCTETASESLNLQFCTAAVNYDIPWNPMTLEQRAGRIDRIGQQRSVVDVMNLFYENTAEHDAYEAVARRFKDIVTNVGTYPPIIAANIQSIIRDGKDPNAELDKITTRNDFDINRLNTLWDSGNPDLNPRITMEDLERVLREPELLPEGWTAENMGGKHWKVTDPQNRTTRVTTDAESYQAADGRLRWWEGPWRT